MVRFSQVDVFSRQPFLGNPVAVVTDAGHLSTEQMAAFARWTNLSETTYLLPPTDAGADYRLRIFTTDSELPFAGHPTLGSARAWLQAGNRPKADHIVQECAAGLVPIRMTADRLAFAGPPLRRSGAVAPADVERLAAGLGIAVIDVVEAQWADNGPGWVALLLRDAAAVLAIEPQLQAFDPFHPIGVVGPHPAGSEAAVEVRAFVSRDNREDPVTGSLNAAIAGWLMDGGHVPERYVAAQGTVLQRRGRIHVERADGQIWVGGDTVVAIEGSVIL